MVVYFVLVRVFLIGVLACPWLHSKKIEKTKELMM
jgi:hypothetical protein